MQWQQNKTCVPDEETLYNIFMENIEKYNLLASYTEEIFSLKLTLADTREKVEAFSREHYFHPLQTWLDPQALQLILEQSRRTYCYRFTDALGLHMVFFYYEDMPVLIGPFLTEPVSRGFCTALKHRYPDQNISVEDILIYFGKYPVIPAEILNRLIAALCGKLGLSGLEDHAISYADRNREQQENPETAARIAGEGLEHHYWIEVMYMDAVGRGNARDALRYLQQTQTHAQMLWNTGGLQMCAAGAAVSRTMARIAAYRAGVPAPLIHRITSGSARRITAAETVDEIRKEQKRVVQELCLAVSHMRSGKYSALVQTVLYALETGYDQDKSERELADEIGVTESYMIAQFRRETGKTPGQYLRDIRMKQAARMLTSSEESIRAVAGKCGIPDSNYFVKLFRAYHGCTPRDYRKKYCV